MNCLRDEKDAALADLVRVKQEKFDREGEVADNCNTKVAHVE